jgi:hypothetical protein
MLSSMFELYKLKKDHEKLKIKVLELLDRKNAMTIDEYELYLQICNTYDTNKVLGDNLNYFEIPPIQNNVKKLPDLPESDSDE